MNFEARRDPATGFFLKRNAETDVCPANRELWDQLTKRERAIWQVGYDFGYQDSDSEHEFDQMEREGDLNEGASEPMAEADQGAIDIFGGFLADCRTRAAQIAAGARQQPLLISRQWYDNLSHLGLISRVEDEIGMSVAPNA